MSSHRRQNKTGKRLNDLIISDDIDTTESYAGVGQQNIVSGDNTAVPTSNTDCLPSKSQTSRKSKHIESNVFNDIKVSPELEFNFQTSIDMRHNGKRHADTEKNTQTHSAISSTRVKSSGNVTSLPLLTVKKSAVERDKNLTKFKSINGQIEKIEHRKEKMSLSEKKDRMNEIRLKAKQNWSNFKADIEFIKSVEMSNSNLTHDSVNSIKDERVLNNILNELCSIESDTAEASISEQSDSLKSIHVDLNQITGDENQQTTVEFKSTIRPMLKSHVCTPLQEDTAMVLKQAIFNSTCRSWGTEWYRQNLNFYPVDSALPFAMIQKMEGPNSVMCAVQAEFLVEAVFHCDISVNWLCNLKRNRNQLLASTLTRIISRCRNSKNDKLHICLLDISLKRRNMGTVKADGITESIVVYQISTKEELEQFILFHIIQFTDNFSPGLILLVVSCLLTHGLSNIMLELNKDNRRLISPLGFPRDELMTLLMTGRVVSHYFNDDIQNLDDSGNYISVRGVSSRSDVGFLYVEPHCEYCKESGTYLKTPKYPIWLAKLEDNNFVILYCLNGSLINDWKTEIKFQLNLYSPMLSKRGVIKMTIDSSVSQTEKLRITEEEVKLANDKEIRHKEVTVRRLKAMSDSALKFLLDEESIEEYLCNSEEPSSQTVTEMDILENIIHTKWPNATVTLSDECIGIFSLVKN